MITNTFFLGGGLFLVNDLISQVPKNRKPLSRHKYLIFLSN